MNFISDINIYVCICVGVCCLFFYIVNVCKWADCSWVVSQWEPVVLSNVQEFQKQKNKKEEKKTTKLYVRNCYVGCNILIYFRSHFQSLFLGIQIICCCLFCMYACIIKGSLQLVYLMWGYMYCTLCKYVSVEVCMCMLIFVWAALLLCSCFCCCCRLLFFSSSIIEGCKCQCVLIQTFMLTVHTNIHRRIFPTHKRFTLVHALYNCIHTFTQHLFIHSETYLLQ